MSSLKEEVLTFLRSEFHDQISDTLRKIQTEAPPQHPTDTTQPAAIGTISEELHHQLTHQQLHHTPRLSHSSPLKSARVPVSALAAVIDGCPSPPIPPMVQSAVDIGAFVREHRTPLLSHRSPLQSFRAPLSATDGYASPNPGARHSPRSQVRRLASSDVPRPYSIGPENRAGAPSNPSVSLSRATGSNLRGDRTNGSMRGPTGTSNVAGSVAMTRNPVAASGGSISVAMPAGGSMNIPVGIPVSKGNSMSVPGASGAMSVSHPGGKGAAGNPSPFFGHGGNAGGAPPGNYQSVNMLRRS